jgi:hypothetical protein
MELDKNRKMKGVARKPLALCVSFGCLYKSKKGIKFRENDYEDDNVGDPTYVHDYKDKEKPISKNVDLTLGFQLRPRQYVSEL